jgi:hypothetical protein
MIFFSSLDFVSSFFDFFELGAGFGVSAGSCAVDILRLDLRGSSGGPPNCPALRFGMF